MGGICFSAMADEKIRPSTDVLSYESINSSFNDDKLCLFNDDSWKLYPTVESAKICYCECYGFSNSELKSQHVELLSILDDKG